MIRRGEAWGVPVGGPPDLDSAGDDVALATAVGHAVESGVVPRVRFDASTASDLARAVGLVGPGTGSGEVLLDVLTLEIDALEVGSPDDRGREVVGHRVDLAVNAVVVGRSPDRLRWWHRRRPCTVVVDGRTVFDARASTVLVANGQFLRGHDVVPAGHPGDGRLEVQVYALGAGERAPMRRRLPGAVHVPHPRITTAAGRSVVVATGRPEPLEVDGRGRGRVRRLRTDTRAGAYRLLV